MVSTTNKKVGRRAQRGPSDLRSGFGFNTPENGEKDCFVHHIAIQAEGYKSPAEGQRVEFEVVQDQKGPAAQNVVKL